MKYKIRLSKEKVGKKQEPRIRVHIDFEDTPFEDVGQRVATMKNSVNLVEEAACDYTLDLALVYIPCNTSRDMGRSKLLPVSITPAEAINNCKRLDKAIKRWHKERYEKLTP